MRSRRRGRRECRGEREGRLAASRAEMEAEMRGRWRRSGSGWWRVEEFRSARERYFAEVEQEVVKLALAIAARVLHREAQIDPLLLTGVVRVALEKMADRSGVVLRVAAVDVEAWERVFRATEASETAAGHGGCAAGAGRVCARNQDGHSGAGCESAAGGD